MATLPHFRSPAPSQKENQGNSLPLDASFELDALWHWYDEEPELWVAIITGQGSKAFCTGMDLKERLQFQYLEPAELVKKQFNPRGFAGMSNRVGLKPIIAACNGHAYGGGFEIILNADIVIASPNASFCLPEGKRGLAALAGALPRIIRNFGLQRAMDLGLTGRALSAEEARRWGLVKEIVPVSEVVARAVQIATSITELSPESVIVTRAGIRQGWESGSVDRATANTAEVWRHKLFTGDNIKEGLAAFREKRKPVWKSSRL